MTTTVTFGLGSALLLLTAAFTGRVGLGSEEHSFLGEVHGAMTAYQRRWPWLQNPRHVRRGRVPLDRVENRQHVHRLADGAHHHDANAAEARVDCSFDHGPEDTRSLSIPRPTERARASG